MRLKLIVIAFLILFSVECLSAAVTIYFYLGERVPQVGNKYFVAHDGFSATFCDDLNWNTGCIKVPKNSQGKYVYATRSGQSYSFTPMSNSAIRLD